MVARARPRRADAARRAPALTRTSTTASARTRPPARRRATRVASGDLTPRPAKTAKNAKRKRSWLRSVHAHVSAERAPKARPCLGVLGRLGILEKGCSGGV